MISPRYLFSIYSLIVVTTLVLLNGNRDDLQSDSPSYTRDQTYRITLLQTNDVQLERFHGSNSLMMGDRKKIISQIRQEVENSGGQVILLSGGDISASIARSEIISLKDLRYTAMTVGRHQFDDSLETIRQQQRVANFPLLSANIFESETGKPLFDAYKLVNIDGLNIAIIGLTEVYQTENHRNENLAGIEFLDPYETASELASMLKKQADIVIVSTHMGHKISSDNKALPSPLSTIEAIDVVLGDHSLENQDSNDQSSCGQFLSRTDLEFKNGQLKVVRFEKLLAY